MAGKKTTTTPAAKNTPVSVESVPVKVSAPFVELNYAIKEPGNLMGANDVKVSRTQKNEVTFWVGHRSMKFHLDKLVALVAVASTMEVGKVGEL